MSEAPITRREPTKDEIDLMGDLRLALRKHPNLPAERMLVIAAQFVGNLTAMQDQRRYTPAAVMEMVAMNIEEGNKAAIEHLMSLPAGAAC